MKPAWSRLGRAATVSLLIAVLCGVALMVAGFLVPVYQWSGSSSSGEVARGSATLVDVNGRRVVVVLAVPLLVTVLVACALGVRPRRGALPFAWTLTALLGVFNLLGMMTIGIFVIPVTVALVVACSTCRSAPEEQSPAPPSVAAH